jgi:multimeric flavodoxin WrbA
MNEIYPLWVAAHGALIVTPVNWYHVPAGLKAMMDRLVCADRAIPIRHRRTARRRPKPRRWG